MSDKLMTVREAAEYLQVHWQTVRNMIRRGRLKSAKVGRRVRILESELKKFWDKSADEKEKLEIEIRFVTEKRKKIEEKLIKMGAKVVYQGHVIDHWYIPNNINSIDEKNEFYETAKGYGLRVREQDNGYTGKITTSLEVKSLAIPYQYNTCIESELGVESYQEADRLLRMINHKEMTTLDKDRLVYKLGSTKVVIDDIRGYKIGVELEEVTDENRENVLARLHNLAGKLGLDLRREMTHKSVTFMYMQEHSRY